MSNAWKQRREGGGRFALWLIRSIGRHGGRGLARLCLYPITAYFLLRRGAERRDSRDYLSRVFGRRAGLREVARHIHTFACTILDRVFLLGEDLRRFDVRVQGVEGLEAQLAQGRGVLLFGSHLGSFEALRALARRRPDVKIRIVLDKAHNPAMTQLLDALNPEIAAGVIDASQGGPSLMLAIKQAADEGALVSLLVDRTHPGAPVQAAQFLGAPAEFPVSPWLVASVLKLPISLGFGLYRGGNRYDLLFESFSDAGIDLPRRGRSVLLASLVQRYASRLEHHARRAPYNWFNFYDFWNLHEDATDAAAPLAAGADADAAGRRDAAVRRAAG
ncbi:acyltransferase [Luteimonas aquatica]|uniref:LpxL/LpxP family acyltransferase n=1 Tax=Luteimonas aquatica TaxID=450364 RepID=UPI001F575DBB|nr:acyltransferase [Luteimonas aquatica]